MGIHFLCPNGHHLNVKKELAGKVGYCPKCRAKLIIPNIDKQSKDGQDSSSEENLAPPRSEGSKEQESPRSHSDLNPRVDLNDVKALWYVRSLDGDQYGPAVGSVIQSWIQERRIGPKMLIWRQGWEKWQEAEKFFPEIRSIFETNDGENAQGEPNEEGVLRETVSRLVDSCASSRSNLTQRKKKAINSFYVILGLIGLIAVLLIALIAVLFTH